MKNDAKVCMCVCARVGRLEWTSFIQIDSLKIIKKDFVVENYKFRKTFERFPEIVSAYLAAINSFHPNLCACTLCG